MIELATAIGAAALINDAVAAVDTIYDWWRNKRGEPPAGLELKADPEQQSLKYIRASDGGTTERVVLTYSQLATKLTADDVAHIQSFEARMRDALGQWQFLNSRLSLKDDVERARIEANMEHLRKNDICKCLDEIIAFIEYLGIDLEDHYASARRVCWE